MPADLAAQQQQQQKQPHHHHQGDEDDDEDEDDDQQYADDLAHQQRLRAEKAAQMAKIQEQLNIENKIKAGAETMLQVYESSQKGDTISRKEVETQLHATNKKIAALTKQMEFYKNLPEPSLSPKRKAKRRAAPSDGYAMGQPSSVSNLTDGRKKLHSRSGSGSTSSTSSAAKPAGNAMPGGGSSASGVGGSSGSNTVGGPGGASGSGLSSRRPELANISKESVVATLNEILSRMLIVSDPGQLRLESMNTLLKFFRNIIPITEISYFFPLETIIRTIRMCLVDPAKEVRANAFRVFRHLAATADILGIMLDTAHVDVFIIRALNRDSRYDVEREQALKLVRAFLDVQDGWTLIPQSVVRTVVAIAEQNDDKFRNICIETLCELAVRNVEVCALCGGLKIVFGSLLEGPKELSEVVMLTILYVLDTEHTRAYLRPRVELEMIISNFTDAFSRGPSYEERLTVCSKAITALLKSWTGLIYLCLDDKRAIRSIVESLKLPYEETRKILLEMFFEIFQIDMPKWYPDFVSARSRSVHYYPVQEEQQNAVVSTTTAAPTMGPTGLGLGINFNSGAPTNGGLGSTSNLGFASAAAAAGPYGGGGLLGGGLGMGSFVVPRERMNLLDSYLTIILIAFVDVGLLETLIHVIQESDKYITIRATILVGEILELCNRLLPGSYGVKINSLPSLFRVASDFDDETRRHHATLALSHIDNLHKNKEKLLPQALEDTVANRRWLARSTAYRQLFSGAAARAAALAANTNLYTFPFDPANNNAMLALAAAAGGNIPPALAAAMMNATAAGGSTNNVNSPSTATPTGAGGGSGGGGAAAGPTTSTNSTTSTTSTTSATPTGGAPSTNISTTTLTITTSNPALPNSTTTPNTSTTSAAIAGFGFGGLTTPTPTAMVMSPVVLGAPPVGPMSATGVIGMRAAGTPTQQRVRKQVEEVKMRLGMQIDDVHFRNMLNDSEVLGIKEYTKWNWDVIAELVQGPLWNPKRLDEAMKGTKFLKRLLSFFRPSTHCFSEIKKGKGSYKYVRVGCELLTMLLATVDGIRFMAENRFLQEIGECLGQLDPTYGDQTEPIFSKERMEKTLTGEYFTLLGTLCRYHDGLRLLERFKIFNLYYHLTELRNRDELIKFIVTTMDYNLEGHPRIILSKILTSGNKHMRLFTTNYLRYLLRTGTQDFWDWGIRMLVMQLYDPVTEIGAKAVDVLDEACNDRRNLEMVVYLRPTFEHLGAAGNALFLRLLSISSGFVYLQELDYVENEMDDWFERGNEEYVTRLELSMVRALSPNRDGKASGSTDRALDSAKPAPDEAADAESIDLWGSVPPHFYGELTKTAEGCELLRRKAHFDYFADFLKRNGLSKPDVAMTRQLKAVLWAVGHIGANKLGLPFLLEQQVIHDIVKMAEFSTVLSLKGTCHYVIGLISLTPKGVEVLESLGWDTVTTPYGNLEGLSVPMDPSRFLTVPDWNYRGSWPDKQRRLRYARTMKLDSVEQEVVKCVGNMSNHILANAASKSLSKLRHEHPMHFTRMSLYIEVLRMVSAYHYRLTTRRFLQELFDRVQFNESGLNQLDDMCGLRFVNERRRRRVGGGGGGEAGGGEGSGGTGQQEWWVDGEDEDYDEEADDFVGDSLVGRGKGGVGGVGGSSSVGAGSGPDKRGGDKDKNKVPQNTKALKVIKGFP
ncbi:hypothetical protein HK102_011873 [Quaeritorhiza haematococci]|nr:hypothetical protein HK102_011873 [Quaeritorhiza haematococci]